MVTIKVDPDKEGYTTTILEFDGDFDCWTHDWYKGEKEVKLIGFCPLSSAAEAGWIMMNNKEGVCKPETDEEDRYFMSKEILNAEITNVSIKKNRKD